jgi:hypothetical protein
MRRKYNKCLVFVILATICFGGCGGAQKCIDSCPVRKLPMNETKGEERDKVLIIKRLYKEKPPVFIYRCDTEFSNCVPASSTVVDITNGPIILYFVGEWDEIRIGSEHCSPEYDDYTYEITPFEIEPGHDVPHATGKIFNFLSCTTGDVVQFWGIRANPTAHKNLGLITLD